MNLSECLDVLHYSVDYGEMIIEMFQNESVRMPYIFQRKKIHRAWKGSNPQYRIKYYNAPTNNKRVILPPMEEPEHR